VFLNVATVQVCSTYRLIFFKMLIQIKKFTAGVAVICAILCLLAAFVPQWVVLDPNTTVGLRQTCRAGACAPTVRSSLFPFSKISDSSTFVARLRTTEAFMWTGAIASFMGAAIAVVGLTGTLRVVSWAASLHLANILALVCFIISLAVGFSTFNMHGPKAHCDSSIGCTYFGPAAVAALVALTTCFFAVVMGVAAHAVADSRMNLLFAAFFLALIATAFAVAAALAPSWLEISLPLTSIESLTSVGTLQSCSGSKCSPLDYNALVVGTCRNGDGSKLKSRFAATTAMMVMGFIIAVAVAIVALLPKMRSVRFALALLQLASVIAGIAVIGDTFDYWMYCGETFSAAAYAAAVASGTTITTAATWGFSFACAVTSAILMGITLLVHIADAMWASSVKTTPTTVVVTTTVPPVVEP
jgi:hypothetical protein